jgi:hypothetical protein
MCGIIRLRYPTNPNIICSGYTGAQGTPGPVGWSREELERLKHKRIMEERILKLEKIKLKLCSYKQI